MTEGVSSRFRKLPGERKADEYEERRAPNPNPKGERGDLDGVRGVGGMGEPGTIWAAQAEMAEVVADRRRVADLTGDDGIDGAGNFCAGGCDRKAYDIRG